MAKKIRKSNSDLSSTDSKASKENKPSTKSGGKKVLSQQEKIEAAKKANQAMTKAWKLIAQRKISDTDAESNV